MPRASVLQGPEPVCKQSRTEPDFKTLHSLPSPLRPPEIVPMGAYNGSSLKRPVRSSGGAWTGMINA